jgi:arylsulfatase A-like enzyme
MSTPLISAWMACSRDTEPLAESPGDDPPQPPNVLVILLDDVGTDKVAAYGEHPQPPHTPHIDALAAEGMLFRNAWAYSSCSPTRAAALTGRYGRRTGLGRVVNAWMEGDYEMPSEEITIPEMLQLAPQPWSSSAVGKWHLATYTSPSNLEHPGVQGFDWYATSVANLDQTSDRGRHGHYFDWERVENGELSRLTTYATTVQVDDALARMQSMPEPWFLWLAFNAPHKPYSLPPPELHGVPADEDSADPVLFAAVMEALDTEIGRLLSAVDLQQTTVILAGDNGTVSFAVLPPWHPRKDKDTMYEGGLGVPLIVAGPPVTQPGSETGALVHLVDVFATVADLAGVELEALGVPIDGRSWLPVLADPDASVREVVYAEELGPNDMDRLKTDERAVRDSRFKYLVEVDEGSEHLFDLQDRVDDGPDLLQAPELSPDAQEALVRLQSELDEIMAGFE